MKVGDSAYLLTDHVKTDVRIPALVCGIKDSTVRVAIEESDGTKVLQVKTEDLLPFRLFTRSVLKVSWLSSQTGKEILQPFTAKEMIARPISKRINKPANNNPSVLEEYRFN
jgi:hypothetical protein